MTFNSDSATGCAAQGWCGYSGTESGQPRGGGLLDVVSYRAHGRRGFAANLVLGDSQSPVVESVRRFAGASGVSVCSDRSSAFSGFLSPLVHDDRITVALGRGNTPLLGTRCAGPLDVDLGRALPAATLAVRGALRGHTVLDLMGTRRFAAHGFAGIVRSTIVLRLGRARTSPAPPTAPDGTSGRRIREVTVVYRLQRVRGSAVARVRATSNPAVCVPLDACGLSGTIDVAPGTAHGTDIYVSASGPARRPYRDFLAALGLRARGDRAGIEVGGAGQQRLHGAVIAGLRLASQCRDSTTLLSTQISLQAHGSRLAVSLSPFASQASDPLRTRCPGPALGVHDLTTADVPLSRLTRPIFSVALRGVSFGDRAYRVRTSSTLVLTLRRTRVTTHTYTLGPPPTPPTR